ncbi:g8497 [Coccomyxa elongata]
MHRWDLFQGGSLGDVPLRQSSGLLDIEGLLEYASQSLQPDGVPVTVPCGTLHAQQVLEPEPPQTLLSGAGPFVAMPPQRGRSFTAVDQNFAHDVLPVRHHSMDPGPASPSGQSSLARNSVGSGDFTPRMQTRRSHNRIPSAAQLQDGGSSSDGSPGGARHGSRQLDDADGLTALREKNRRAQRKFRERQKAKLAESEGRARQLEAALEHLKLEKSALETRNALLEKMVGMRGEQPRPQPPPAAARTEGTPLNGVPVDVPERGDGVDHRSRRDDAVVETVLHSQQTMELTIRQGRPGLRSVGVEALTLEHVKSLPHAELAALWKDYVSALTGLLQEARGDPASPAGQRIGELIGEVRMVVSCLMSSSTHRWSTLRALKMDPKGQASTVEAPPPDWSRKMYRAMKMSGSQRRAAVAYRNHLLLRLGDTLRARRDISLELLRTLGGARAEAIAGDMQGGTAMAHGLLVASNAAEALRSNIAEEQQLYSQFVNAVRSIVQPIQTAIAIVQAYPWCPDALAIFNCAAEEEGAPPAHELLACPVPGGPGVGPPALLSAQLSTSPKLEMSRA